MTKKIKIANKLIGIGEPTFIIVEVGSNHDRNLSQAKELIDVACTSGVDAVKFQLFRAESFYKRNDPMFEVMKKNEFPREWLRELCVYAKKKDVIFMASPFDKEAIDLLQEIGSPVIKWASSETVNLPLLRYAASKKKPIFISTGMCNLADIYEAVRAVTSCGNDNIVLMQCTSLYPTEPKDVNLHVMDTLRDAFRYPVGYSDHTLGFTIAVAAVARGACVIEKHFTLSRKLKGPDHSYALEPDELKKMVKAIRDVEESLGTYVKEMHPDERKLARRTSIIAKKNISKGTKITQDLIKIDRPALGIEPRFLPAIIDAKANKKINKGEGIDWNKVE